MTLPENSIICTICTYITSFDAQVQRRRNNNYNEIYCYSAMCQYNVLVWYICIRVFFFLYNSRSLSSK